MQNSIFNSDLPVFRFIYKLVVTVLLGVMTLVFCLFIVTGGGAVAALYRTIVKCIRKENGNPFTDYFRYFKDNIKPGMWLSLLIFIITAGLGYGLYISIQLRRATDSIPVAPYIAGALLLSVAFIVPYTFPLVASFTYSVKEYLIYSIYLAGKYLTSTLLFGTLIYGGVAALIIVPALRRFLWAYPGILCFLVSVRMEEIFSKEVNADPQA